MIELTTPSRLAALLRGRCERPLPVHSLPLVALITRSLWRAPHLLLLCTPLLVLGTKGALGGPGASRPWALGVLCGLQAAMRRLLRAAHTLPEDAMHGRRTLAGWLGFHGTLRAVALLTALLVGLPLWAFPMPLSHGVCCALLGAVSLFWALLPAAHAVAPHDPRLARALCRLDRAQAAFTLALVGAALLPG